MKENTPCKYLSSEPEYTVSDEGRISNKKGIPIPEWRYVYRDLFMDATKLRKDIQLEKSLEAYNRTQEYVIGELEEGDPAYGKKVAKASCQFAILELLVLLQREPKEAMTELHELGNSIVGFLKDGFKSHEELEIIWKQMEDEEFSPSDVKKFQEYINKINLILDRDKADFTPEQIRAVWFFYFFIAKFSETAHHFTRYQTLNIENLDNCEELFNMSAEKEFDYRKSLPEDLIKNDPENFVDLYIQHAETWFSWYGDYLEAETIYYTKGNLNDGILKMTMEHEMNLINIIEQYLAGNPLYRSESAEHAIMVLAKKFHIDALASLENFYKQHIKIQKLADYAEKIDSDKARFMVQTETAAMLQKYLLATEFEADDIRLQLYEIAKQNYRTELGQTETIISEAFNEAPEQQVKFQDVQDMFIEFQYELKSDLIKTYGNAIRSLDQQKRIDYITKTQLAIIRARIELQEFEDEKGELNQIQQNLRKQTKDILIDNSAFEEREKSGLGLPPEKNLIDQLDKIASKLEEFVGKGDMVPIQGMAFALQTAEIYAILGKIELEKINIQSQNYEEGLIKGKDDEASNYFDRCRNYLCVAQSLLSQIKNEDNTLKLEIRLMYDDLKMLNYAVSKKSIVSAKTYNTNMETVANHHQFQYWTKAVCDVLRSPELLGSSNYTDVLSEKLNEVLSRSIRIISGVQISGDSKPAKQNKRKVRNRYAVNKGIETTISIPGLHYSILINSQTELTPENIKLIENIASTLSHLLSINKLHPKLDKAENDEEYEGIWTQIMVESFEILKKLFRQQHPQTLEHAMRMGDFMWRLFPGRTDIYYATLLHDFGKILLDEDLILNKAAKPAPFQWAKIEEHVSLGSHMQINGLLGIKHYARPIAMSASHHEHYDGSGYPLGLKGNDFQDLPRHFYDKQSLKGLTDEEKAKTTMPFNDEELKMVEALRIFDTMEAVTSGKRAYNKKRPKVALVELLERYKGLNFPPHVVESMIKLLDQGFFDDLFADDSTDNLFELNPPTICPCYEYEIYHEFWETNQRQLCELLGAGNTENIKEILESNSEAGLLLGVNAFKQLITRKIREQAEIETVESIKDTLLRLSMNGIIINPNYRRTLTIQETEKITIPQKSINKVLRMFKDWILINDIISVPIMDDYFDN